MCETNLTFYTDFYFVIDLNKLEHPDPMCVSFSLMNTTCPLIHVLDKCQTSFEVSLAVTCGRGETASRGEAVDLSDLTLLRNPELSTAASKAFISTDKSKDYAIYR